MELYKIYISLKCGITIKQPGKTQDMTTKEQLKKATEAYRIALDLEIEIGMARGNDEQSDRVYDDVFEWGVELFKTIKTLKAIVELEEQISELKETL